MQEHKEYKRRVKPENELGDDYPMYAQLGPYYRNVFTDSFGGMVWGYQGSQCGNIEMSMMNCFEAYGYAKSQGKCRTYIYDFQECISNDKTLRRVGVMRAERNKQYFRGERTPRFEDPPKMGTFGRAW